MLYYVPNIVYGKLQEQEIGDVKHILQGDISYGIRQDNIDEIKAKFPNHLIKEIISDRYRTRNPLEGKFELHSVTVKIIPQLPFPKIIFSATLEKNEDDYLDVLNNLRSAWADGSLLKGALFLTVDFSVIKIKFRVFAKFEEVKADRELNLPNVGITELEIWNFIHNIIEKKTVSCATEIGTNVESLCKQYAVDMILREHFERSLDGDVLDDGTKIRLWNQTQVRPGNSVHDFVAIKTMDSIVELSI
jgi:hypothetical protein